MANWYEKMNTRLTYWALGSTVVVTIVVFILLTALFLGWEPPPMPWF